MQNSAAGTQAPEVCEDRAALSFKWKGEPFIPYALCALN